MSRNASNTSATAAASPTNTTMKSSGVPPSTPPLSPSVTKLCHIVKRLDFEGYGFNLHSEKVKPGQYIGKVDATSPAEAAGLKEGDRIVEVNDVDIGSETHKKVVQRIKAIACEVRLLLIDVDGKGDGHDRGQADKQHATAVMSSLPTEKVPIFVNDNINNNNNNMNNSTEEYHSTVQEMPGASANISSISMTSTKRMSNASNQSLNGHTNRNRHKSNSDISMDVTDKAVNIAAPAIGADIAITQNQNVSNKTFGSISLITQERNGTSQQQQAAMKANNNILTTPPPPSAAIATVRTQQQPQAFSNAFSDIGSSSNSNTTSTTTATNHNVTEMAALSEATTTSNKKGNGGNQFGSLKLPMTAAEMRAKLLTKKKYDPKNENVDLKKKFEIIQKL